MLIPLGILDYPVSAAGASAYDLLETEILTGTQASVTFSSLNSTYGADYQSLQIRLTVRGVHSSTTRSVMRYQFNGDTGSNYADHELLGNGSSVSSGAGANQPDLGFGDFPYYVSTGDEFGAAVIDILDPFETTKYTTGRALGGQAVTSSRIQLSSGLWMNTAAVDSIRFFNSLSGMHAGSRFSLYGLKAA